MSWGLMLDGLSKPEGGVCSIQTTSVIGTEIEFSLGRKEMC